MSHDYHFCSTPRGPNRLYDLWAAAVRDAARLERLALNTQILQWATGEQYRRLTDYVAGVRNYDAMRVDPASGNPLSWTCASQHVVLGDGLAEIEVHFTL